MKPYFTTFILTLLFLASTFTVSPAQIDWTKDSDNPVLSPGKTGTWEDYGVYAPFVLKQGDSLKMWYTGIKSYGLQQIGYATSIDGITWHRDPRNPVLKVGTPGSWGCRVCWLP